MSLDKAVLHKKEHRKPYRGRKAVYPSCRRKDCPACENNALHSLRKRVLRAESSEQDAP